MVNDDKIAGEKDCILVTGSSGFIGRRVVRNLLGSGYKNLRCFVRPSSNLEVLNKIIDEFSQASIEVVEGNLLSRKDCEKAFLDVAVVYHLAAGRGKKSYADAFLMYPIRLLSCIIVFPASSSCPIPLFLIFSSRFSLSIFITYPISSCIVCWLFVSLCSSTIPIVSIEKTRV